MFNQDFYTHAEAYDIAFSYRDIPAECDFLEWVFREHASENVRAAKDYLDICAGPSPHGIEMARRGWRSTGVDLSADMKSYALARAAAARVPLDYVVADIRSFRLQRSAALAGCYIDSLTHLTANEDIVGHFRTLGENMRSGGLYVIEMAHPRYIFRTGEPNLWSARRGNREVEILYGLPDDLYDTVTQIWELTTRMTLTENGRIVEQVQSTVEHRFYLCQELRALIDLAGVFDACFFYSALSLPAEPLAHRCRNEKMVAVLRFK